MSKKKEDGRAKYKRKHKQLGLCVECSRPAIPGRTLCKIHSAHNSERCSKSYYDNLDKRRREMKRRREQYRKDGRCIMCSAYLQEEDEGFVNCMNCRQGGTIHKRTIGTPLFTAD